MMLKLRHYNTGRIFHSQQDRTVIKELSEMIEKDMTPNTIKVKIVHIDKQRYYSSDAIEAIVAFTEDIK